MSGSFRLRSTGGWLLSAPRAYLAVQLEFIGSCRKSVDNGAGAPVTSTAVDLPGRVVNTPTRFGPTMNPVATNTMAGGEAVLEETCWFQTTSSANPVVNPPPKSSREAAQASATL